MTEFAETLRKRGLSELAIQRVLSVKEAHKFSDDDPVFALFFELEWYVKQMESIPNQIEQTQQACQAVVQAETEKLVQRSVSEFAREISFQIGQTLAVQAKTDFLRAFARSCALILLVAAIALTVGYSLSGRWPGFFDAHATDNAVLNFIYGCLQAPTYLTVMVVLLVIPTVTLAEKLMYRCKKRR